MELIEAAHGVAQDFQRGVDLAEEAMLMEAMEEAESLRKKKDVGFLQVRNHGNLWVPPPMPPPQERMPS